MKVLEMFETHYSLANQKMEYIVKPKGTEAVYYHGNGMYYRPEVAKMDVKLWFIDNRGNLIIIVDRDEALEEKKKAFFDKAKELR